MEDKERKFFINYASRVYRSCVSFIFRMYLERDYSKAIFKLVRTYRAIQQAYLYILVEFPLVIPSSMLHETTSKRGERE